MPSSEDVNLSDLVRDPSKISTVPGSRIPVLLTQLSSLQTAMAARLMDGADDAKEGAALLTVEEAAERIGVPLDWIYRRTKTLPFIVRLGRHVRCSPDALERFVKNRTGR